jgi:homoserine dehydrogenase
LIETQIKNKENIIMNNVVNVAVAGLGTVGGGFIDLITENGDLINKKLGKTLKLYAVSDLDKNRCPKGDVKFYENALEMVKDENIDIIVELIGGTRFAKTLVEEAIKNGKHIATANKALLAEFGNELSKMAEEKDVNIGFEASVAGCIPIIRSLRGGLSSNRVSRIYGILNGTCNYILSVMEKTGREFLDVLKEAQEKGYAEAEPSLDIDGLDTAHKLAILTSLAYHMPIKEDDIFVEGIRHISKEDISYAKDMGYKIKLLGIADRVDEKKISAHVFPCLVKNEAQIASIMGVYNCVNAKADYVGNVSLIGKGAGAKPTATAVMSDVMDIAADINTKPLIMPYDKLEDLEIMSISDYEGEYYMRLKASDETGVLSQIANVLSNNGISISTMVQDQGDENSVMVIMTFHKTKESDVVKALKELEEIKQVLEKPCIIRIVDFDE